MFGHCYKNILFLSKLNVVKLFEYDKYKNIFLIKL